MVGQSGQAEDGVEWASLLVTIKREKKRKKIHLGAMMWSWASILWGVVLTLAFGFSESEIVFPFLFAFIGADSVAELTRQSQKLIREQLKVFEKYLTIVRGQEGTSSVGPVPPWQVG